MPIVRGCVPLHDVFGIAPCSPNRFQIGLYEGLNCNLHWAPPFCGVRQRPGASAAAGSAVRCKRGSGWPVPSLKPGCDAVAVHSAATWSRREIVDHSVRRMGLDDGVCVAVSLRFYQLFEKRSDLGSICCRTHRMPPFRVVAPISRTTREEIDTHPHRCDGCRHEHPCSQRAPQRTAQLNESVPIWPGQFVGDLEPRRHQFREDMPVRADFRIVIEQASVYLEPVPSGIHIGRGYVRTAATAEADAVRWRCLQDWRFIARNQFLPLHKPEVLWSGGNSSRERRACRLPAAIAMTELEQREYARNLEPHSTTEAGAPDHDGTSLLRPA